MKRVASAMTVLLLVFAAGNAKAASLAPPSVSFNAIGSLSIASVVGNLNCSATMSGSIDDYGVGQITNIQLSGGPLNSCAACCSSFSGSSPSSSAPSSPAVLSPIRLVLGPRG